MENLSQEEIKDIHIRVSYELEQFLSEGNYNQILGIKSEVNSEFYNYYLNKFNETIRYQVARSAERSYDSLLVKDSLIMLNLNNLNDLVKYISTVPIDETMIEWRIQGDRLLFVNLDDEKLKIPAYDIMIDGIKVAAYTERIV